MATLLRPISIEGRTARSIGRAAAVSTGLSILFLVVYSGCNWITGRRHDVGLFYFQWERGIPFIPFFITPYLSIDLFFVAAPFLCRSDYELRTFSRRVATAILIAGVCFLLFPLRFAFPHPHAEGWIGIVFDWFRGLDAPYNLLPSLHAALCLLLVHIYGRHTRGVWRGFLTGWFVLIGLSPIFTLQHHVIDIVGGFVLAGYCFYFFPDSPIESSGIRNKRIGVYYAIGTGLLLILALTFRPLGALLLWPAVSLGIVATGYFGRGPKIFRKSNGRLPWSTRFVLGPNLIGQYFSWLYYRRQCHPWDKITSNVWIGRQLSNCEANDAIDRGVTAVLDLSAEFSEIRPFRESIYKNIPILDLTAPSPDQLRQAADFISTHSDDGIVYVHCKIGYSRSAAAVAAYLYLSGKVDGIAEALSIIRSARPSIVIRPEILSALRVIELERPLFSSLPG